MLLLSILAFVAGAVATIAYPEERALSARALFNATQLSYLWGHNQVRLQHASPGLVWNETLADRALQWASFCRLQHSRGTLLDGEPYGENLVAGTGEFPIEDAMAQFTLDESDFDPSNPTYNHWTQVVWASTTQLGCASVSCSNLFAEKATYYVCLYSPPGNVIGQASDNVNVF